MNLYTPSQEDLASITPADARAWLRAKGIPKDSLEYGTVLFWSGIYTLDEYRDRYGNPDLDDEIQLIKEAVCHWLNSPGWPCATCGDPVDYCQGHGELG